MCNFVHKSVPLALLAVASACYVRAALLLLPAFAVETPVDKLNVVHESSFVVYPADLNHMDTLFGGRLASEMDRTAGIAVRRLLYSSKTARRAVTMKVEDLEFDRPCRKGDLVLVRAKVVDLGRKSVKVSVLASREEAKALESVATATFIFVAVDDGGRPTEHGLELP